MMFNKLISFSQSNLRKLYENSLFLQNIDWFILLFIILTFVGSTFLQSDSIGFFAIVVMFLTLVKVLTKPEEKIEINNFEIWLIAYFMVVLISLFGSTLFYLSLKGFFKTFVYVGYYFSAAHYMKANKNHIKWILGAIALCAGGEILVGFMQTFIHPEAISTWQDTSYLNPEDVISRVYGTLKPLNPNLFGGYLVGVIPAVIGSCFYFINKKLFKAAVLWGGISVLGVFTIFQTGCRGAYLALILILGCIFLITAKFFWHKYKKLYFSIISSVICFFFASIMFVSSLRHRFLSIFAMREDSSNSFRFNVYNSSLEMFKDNWLLGIGVGNKNFREIYGLYMKTGFDALSAYNIYLETAVESGIFALICFLGFLIYLCKQGITYILNSKETQNIIYISIALIGILAMLFHGLVDTIYFRPQLQFVFWTYVGIISAVKLTEKA